MTHIAIPWWRYAERIGYRECAYAGVNHPDNPRYACGAVWTGAQRAMMAQAVAEAQEEIEQEVGFFLAPDWAEGERQTWSRRMFTHWAYVIEPGVLLDTVLGSGIAVVHSSDPATVTVPLGICPAEDVHLYFTGTDTEVYPTNYSVDSVGNAVFEVPWCRLVDPKFEDTDEAGLDYADVSTWVAHTLDARCRVTYSSVQATLIWRGNACTPPCDDIRRAGCIYVRDERMGSVEAWPASYSGGVWSRLCGCYGDPDWALLNYKSGLLALTPQIEDTVLRLAHSKMPEEPCGCDVTQRLWKRDRNVPTVLTGGRINCPFGMSDGAWIAWCWAHTKKVIRSRGNL
jgi:hypothetical protein